jgi:BASS family bile acid:Na+ symporter
MPCASRWRGSKKVTPLCWARRLRRSIEAAEKCVRRSVYECEPGQTTRQFGCRHVGIVRLLPLEEALQIGLIVLATTAGAPFLVKEVQAAQGNLSLGVGQMFLLMVVTIFYVPIVLPFLLPGVEVNPWDLAKSLIVTMLVPIVLGLLYRSHSPESAQQWAPLMNKVSGIALLIMLVTGLGLNLSNIIDLIGSWGFLALILFVVGSLLIGMLLGGRDPAVRSVLGLGTAQRNVAAAILVASLNFPGTMTLPFVLVASIILPLILIPTARMLGRHGAAGVAAAPRPTPTET